jgi:hypothetical protein
MRDFRAGCFKKRFKKYLFLLGQAGRQGTELILTRLALRGRALPFEIHCSILPATLPSLRSMLRVPSGCFQVEHPQANMTVR